MYEKIVEIIIYVISELKQKRLLSEVIINELQKKGYTNSEISTAFSWISDTFNINEKLIVSDNFMNKDSFRIFHTGEREMFTDKAFGELIQYHSLGLLNNDQIETLIENSALAGWEKIDSLELKYYLASVIFSTQENLFPGNKFMLSGDEQIN